VKERRSKVDAVAGTLAEIDATKKKKEKTYSTEYKKDFYHQLLQYAKGKGYKDGWAYYAYKDKFGVYPSFEKVTKEVGYEVYAWIAHRNIKQSKGRKYA
jgi:hypothetical protein